MIAAVGTRQISRRHAERRTEFQDLQRPFLLLAHEIDEPEQHLSHPRTLQLAFGYVADTPADKLAFRRTG